MTEKLTISRIVCGLAVDFVLSFKVETAVFFV